MIKVTKEEAEDIICEDSERFELIEEIDCGKQGRWCIAMETIVKDRTTDKFYSISWLAPATEQQEGQDRFYDNEVELIEVEKVEVVKKEWKVKE